MTQLPVTIEPCNNIKELTKHLRHSLTLLPESDEQEIAHTMVAQIIAAKHDEWWRGESPVYPQLAQAAELLIHLETPDGNQQQRQQQWDTVNSILKAIET